MYVVKRDGRKEQVMFDKITARVRKLCYGLNELVDPLRVTMRVIEGLYDGVTTSELDNLAAEIAATIMRVWQHVYRFLTYIKTRRRPLARLCTTSILM